MYPDSILQWLGACLVVFGILAVLAAVVWYTTGAHHTKDDDDD